MSRVSVGAMSMEMAAMLAGSVGYGDYDIPSRLSRRHSMAVKKANPRAGKQKAQRKARKTTRKSSP